MISGRSLVSTSQLNDLHEELTSQVDRHGVWGAVTHHVRRGVSRHAAVLDRRLDGVAWWPNDSSKDSATPEIDEIARWCLRSGRNRVVPRSLEDGSQGVTVLLSLRERGDVLAVLQVAFEEPLPPNGLEDLAALASFISAQLTNRAWASEAQLLAMLESRLAVADSVGGCASTAMTALAPAVGASAGVLLEVKGRTLTPLATFGDVSEDLKVKRPPSRLTVDDPLYRVIDDREVLFSEGHPVDGGPLLNGVNDHAALAVPLEGRGPVRSVMVLTFEPGRVPSASILPKILGASDVISSRLARLRRRFLIRRLDEMVTSNRNVRGSHAMRQLLGAATDIVPGAELGLAFQRDDSGSYSCWAGGSQVNKIKLSVADALSMYQGSRDEWECGLPRPFEGLTPPVDALRRATPGRVRSPTESSVADGSCLCVPFVVGGSVTTFVLLFNSVSRDAFDEESISSARQLISAACRLLEDADR